MKKLICLLFVFSFLFAFDVKYKYYIPQNMQENALLEKIKSLPPYSAVIFPQKRNYYFFNEKLVVNKPIAIFANYSSLNGINITLKKSFFIGGFSIFKGSSINIENVKNFKIVNTFITGDTSKINIKNSKGHIVYMNLASKDSYLSKIYQSLSNETANKHINIENSQVILNYSNIFSKINIQNSNVKFNQIYFSNVNNGSFVDSYNSNILLQDSTFYNKTAGNNKTYASFFNFTNSQAIIKNTSFTNNWRGVYSVNSKSLFKNNKFSNLNIGIVLTKKSYSYISNNEFKDAINNYSEGIDIYNNSKIYIKENIFKNIYTGIELRKTTQANIYDNTFEDLKQQHYTKDTNGDGYIDKEGDYYGAGVFLSSYSRSNIKNNTLASEKAYLIYSLKNSQFYQTENLGDINTNSNQVNNPIPIKVEQVGDFLNIFMELSKDFDDIYKKTTDAPLLQSKIYEGYLQMPEDEDLVIRIGDAEEVIDNGIYLKIKQDGDNYIIIYPKEYEGLKLKKLPNLVKKVKFDIYPIYKEMSNRAKISFIINTNDVIKKIELNHKKLTLLKTGNGYKTISRIMRKFRNAQVVIFFDNFEISYNCNVIDSNYMKCKKMKKDDL